MTLAMPPVILSKAMTLAGKPAEGFEKTKSSSCAPSASCAWRSRWRCDGEARVPAKFFFRAFVQRKRYRYKENNPKPPVTTGSLRSLLIPRVSCLTETSARRTARLSCPRGSRPTWAASPAGARSSSPAFARVRLSSYIFFAVGIFAPTISAMRAYAPRRYPHASPTPHSNRAFGACAAPSTCSSQSPSVSARKSNHTSSSTGIGYPPSSGRAATRGAPAPSLGRCPR